MEWVICVLIYQLCFRNSVWAVAVEFAILAEAVVYKQLCYFAKKYNNPQYFSFQPNKYLIYFKFSTCTNCIVKKKKMYECIILKVTSFRGINRSMTAV